MKTFIAALAVLAASVSAEEIPSWEETGDDELAPFEALDELIYEFVDDIDDAIEDVADFDWERALNKVECWWASLEPQTECRELLPSFDDLADECYTSGYDNFFDWETGECMLYEEYARRDEECWLQNGWYYGGKCNFYMMSQLQANVNLMQRRLHARTMAVSVSVNSETIETVLQPVIQGYAEGESLVNEIQNEIQSELETIARNYERNVTSWWQNQEQVEMEASYQLAEYFVDNVVIDGMKLSDIIGTPDQWVMNRHAVARKPQALMSLEELPSNFTVTWDGPSMSELELTLQEWGNAWENIGYQSNDVIGAIEDVLDDAEDLFSDAEIDQMAENMGEDLGDLVNTVASWVKEQGMTNLEMEPTVVLASKGTAEPASSSVVPAFAAGFGAVCAAAVVYSVYNRKRVVPAQEEPLL